MAVVLTVLGIIALRLIDVSIGALRIQYLVRGRRVVAGLLGFVESLTWVVAAGLVLSDLNEWYKVVAYAAGFGLGTAARRISGWPDRLRPGLRPDHVADRYARCGGTAARGRICRHRPQR